MKRIGSFVWIVVLFASMGAGAARATDGVLVKEEYAPGSYCHLKFPAIREETIAGDHPVLKDPSESDIIDFYGPCDESPTGKDQVHTQQIENGHGWASR